MICKDGRINLDVDGIAGEDVTEYLELPDKANKLITKFNIVNITITQVHVININHLFCPNLSKILYKTKSGVFKVLQKPEYVDVRGQIKACLMR